MDKILYIKWITHVNVKSIIIKHEKCCVIPCDLRHMGLRFPINIDNESD